MSESIMKARTFFRALQRAPEPVRKKWMTGASAVAFAVIIVGWVFYLNLSLTPAGSGSAKVEESGGFFTTIGKGFEVFGSALSEEWDSLRTKGESLWSGLGAQLANPTVFSFIREEPPFVVEPSEPVPPQTLPVK